MAVCEKAYAKINLFLDVTGRREDGFHDILSIMHSVSLHDRLTVTASLSDSTKINLKIAGADLEADESNLVYRSAAKYLSYFGINAEVDILLEKHIPIGAGLGGGSSDAAATLRALNKIFGNATEDQLIQMGAELGSDVPFCIPGGCAICTGRGEKIQKFDYKFNRNYRNIVIAIGEGRVSTPVAYSLLDEKYGDFKTYNMNKSFPDLHCIPTYNIFESVIKNDEIEEIKKIMLENGAMQTLMSGSGPSVFGGFKNIFSASNAVKRLEKQGYSAYRCRLI